MKQIGCEGKDAKFIPCSECLHNNDIQRCYETRKEGNLEIVNKLKI
jgi:hypothetical protein